MGSSSTGSLHPYQGCSRWRYTLPERREEIATVDNHMVFGKRHSTYIPKDTPNLCLLDSEMEVILRTESEDIELRELDACERLALRKFGIVLLRREFSTTSSDESPVLHNCPAYAV